MALVDDEQTVHDGQPIELYEFAISGGTTYRYTSHEVDVTALSQTWTAAAIDRGDVAGASVADPPALEVTASYDLSIVDELAFELPPKKTTLTLRRYHGDEANMGVLWLGRVASCEVSGREARIVCPSVLRDALRTQIPRVAYQSICNHVLGDSRCGVNMASFDLATTVSSISPTDSRVITLASIGGAADQTYRGGELVRDSDGDRRLIVDQSGTVITVNRPFRALAATDAVTAFQGCDHTESTCDSKFSNLDNFGGHPDIPDKDIFRSGVKGF